MSTARTAFLMALGLCATNLAKAQQSTLPPTLSAESTNQTTILPTDESSVPKRLGLTLSTAYNTDLKANSDVERSRNVDVTATPSFRISSKSVLTLVVSGNKDLVGERLWLWNDTYLGASQALAAPVDGVKLSLIGRAFHPTSDDSKDIATLRTKFYLGPQVALDGNKLVGIPLNVTYRPYGQLSFHRYEVGLNGKSNNQYSLSHRLILDASLTEQWGLAFDNIYGRSWTYAGNTRDTFSFDQSVYYAPLASFSVSLGHSIGGGALRPNGRDSSVELFDKNKSSFYLSFDYQL